MDLSKFLLDFKKLFGEDLLDLLENIDEESVSPFALILGLDKKLLTNLLKVIPRLMRREIDLKTVLPYLLPVALGFFASLKKSGSQNDEPQNVNDNLNKNAEKPTYSPTFDNLSEVSLSLNKDDLSFFDDDISCAIELYLQSDNPS